ncbi:TPA: SMEK domain-containing protein [Bacillus mycoides]|nr:SMEK domain-containing protein [Bacillus mycoides]HDR7630422.1 SMEK domain-containing protein [Bacillus mycoides]
MLKRKDKMDDVIKGLSLLQFYLRYSSNKLGLHDINKMCEPFFCELFNILWNKGYQRLESEKKNYPGIDLGDKINKSSVQITSDGTKQKLWDTINKFEDNELYVYYDELIHFVVGEKDYQPKEKDQVKFEKDNCGTYIAHKTIDEYEYSIRIIDLMDLIEFIDQLVGEEFSNIHDYIKNHISEPVGMLKNNAYNIEPNELKTFTAKSFMDYCDVETLTKQQIFFIDIQDLANKINEMDINSRKFLYGVLDNHSKNSTDSDYITVHPDVIRRRLNMEYNEFNSEIEVLKNANLFDEDTAEEEGVLRICFHDSDSTELIGTIYKYCLINEISLKDLILKPDFSLLD